LWVCVVMIVGMSDVSYLPGVSGSRPGSRPVEPTAPNFLGALLRAVNPLARRNDVSGSLMGPTATTLANANAPFTTGAIAERGSAGLGDVAKDLGMYAVGGAAGAGIGRGIQAAIPVARTAMGTTARTLSGNPALSPGARNVMELINARHASPSTNLGSQLSHPRDVPVLKGRDKGPGFYYDTNRPRGMDMTYEDVLRQYGDNFYMPKMSFSDMMRIGRSRGMADPFDDLKLGSSSELSRMDYDNPVIQDALGEGFTGIRGWTNWLVGNPDRVGGLPNLGVRPVTPADDATYPGLEAMLRRIFGEGPFGRDSNF